MNSVCHQKLKIGSNYITEFNRMTEGAKNPAIPTLNIDAWINILHPLNQVCVRIFSILL